MKKINLLFVSVLFLGIAFQSCNRDANKDVNCDEFHWSYEGEGAPENWSVCYDQCGGKQQSPIDISTTVSDPMLSSLSVHYQESQIDLLNNGHSIEFSYNSGSYLELAGVQYELLQFHFHTESEHTVNGKHYLMEVHLVHKNEANGQLVVVGVFFEEGAENSTLNSFIADLPPTENSEFTSDQTISAESLLPENAGYYTYTGSLTTPPCSEIVTWFVMKTPLTASAEQIQKFHDLMHSNYRPVQPLNGREIRAF